MVSLPQGMKIVLLDLEGTIHLGGTPIPGAVDFIQRCHAIYIMVGIPLSPSFHKRVEKKFSK